MIASLNSSTVVIDTNMVLDCFVFADPAVAHLCAEITSGRIQWIATPAMRQEFMRVLSYPQIKQWVKKQAVLAKITPMDDSAFDQYAVMLEPAPPSRIICSDPDDQIFIDLAVAHQAVLLSKDRAVLQLRGKLLQAGVRAGANESVIFQR